MSKAIAGPDIDPRAPLRVAVDRLEAVVAAAECSSELRDAWGDLVKILALGEAPAVRICSKCGKAGMLDATRCGYCWEPQRGLDPHDAS